MGTKPNQSLVCGSFATTQNLFGLAFGKHCKTKKRVLFMQGKNDQSLRMRHFKRICPMNGSASAF